MSTRKAIKRIGMSHCRTGIVFILNSHCNAKLFFFRIKFLKILMQLHIFWIFFFLKFKFFLNFYLFRNFLLCNGIKWDQMGSNGIKWDLFVELYFFRNCIRHQTQQFFVKCISDQRHHNLHSSNAPFQQTSNNFLRTAYFAQPAELRPSNFSQHQQKYKLISLFSIQKSNK